MGARMSRPRISKEDGDSTEGALAVVQSPPTGMPNPMDELQKRPIFLSVPTLVHPDDDSISAMSEETTTLMTRSTNSSISNLSSDSKKSVIEKGRSFSKYLALPSNRVIVLHNKRRHSTPQEQDKLDDAAMMVAQIPLFNKVSAPPFGHRLYCPPPRSEPVSVSPITELEEYTGIDIDMLNLAKSKVLPPMQDDVPNSSRHEPERETKSKGDVWLQKAMQSKVCEEDLTWKMPSATTSEHQINTIDVLAKSNAKSESRAEGLTGKLAKSSFYSTFHKRQVPGRLKKDLNGTYVQRSIFSFCTGLSNQATKSKRKSSGADVSPDFTPIDQILPEHDETPTKDGHSGLRVSTRYKFPEEKVTQWSYNLSEMSLRKSPVRSHSWASGNRDSKDFDD